MRVIQFDVLVVCIRLMNPPVAAAIHRRPPSAVTAFVYRRDLPNTPHRNQRGQWIPRWTPPACPKIVDIRRAARIRFGCTFGQRSARENRNAYLKADVEDAQLRWQVGHDVCARTSVPAEVALPARTHSSQ